MNLHEIYKQLLAMGVYFSESPSRGGGGVCGKDQFPLKYAIFSYFLFIIFDFCFFPSFFANFSYFLGKYPNLKLKF